MVLGFTVSIYKTVLLKGSHSIVFDRDSLLTVQPNLLNSAVDLANKIIARFLKK